jgi:hypothetical protein
MRQVSFQAACIAASMDQWRSAEDYQAMRENPAPLPYFQEALTIAKFDPGMYEVVETYAGTATEP